MKSTRATIRPTIPISATTPITSILVSLLLRLRFFFFFFLRLGSVTGVIADHLLRTESAWPPTGAPTGVKPEPRAGGASKAEGVPNPPPPN